MSRVSSFVQPQRSTERSAISGSGLPMNFGRRPVARKSISQTLPQSGTEPQAVGHTQSGLVARNFTPRVRRMQASSSFWKVSSVSKPQIRRVIPSSSRSVIWSPASCSCCRKVRVPKA